MVLRNVPTKEIPVFENPAEVRLYWLCVWFTGPFHEGFPSLSGVPSPTPGLSIQLAGRERTR